MAILKPPAAEGGANMGALAPAGTYAARIIEVHDVQGVERQKYQSTETEIVDESTFYFGIKGQDGQLYKVRTFAFKQSGSPKSNLYKFLSALLGHAPKHGWDYAELQGKECQITVAHKTSADGTKTYANVISISPLMAQLENTTPPVEAFGPVFEDAAAPAPLKPMDGQVYGNAQPQQTSIPHNKPAWAPSDSENPPF